MNEVRVVYARQDKAMTEARLGCARLRTAKQVNDRGETG
jgi:hypothetical protein